MAAAPRSNTPKATLQVKVKICGEEVLLPQCLTYDTVTTTFKVQEKINLKLRAQQHTQQNGPLFFAIASIADPQPL